MELGDTVPTSSFSVATFSAPKEIHRGRPSAFVSAGSGPQGTSESEPVARLESYTLLSLDISTLKELLQMKS